MLRKTRALVDLEDLKDVLETIIRDEETHIELFKNEEDSYGKRKADGR